MGWRIPDWEKFEPPPRSDRNTDGALRWWKCPVTQNRRYKWLVKQRNGWKLLGVWSALVSCWGRQSKKSRQGGVFRTVSSGDQPATLEELSGDSMVPKRTLEAAIKQFLEIGWLAVVAPVGIPKVVPPVVPEVVPVSHRW